MTQTVSTKSIQSLASSKLTGALPAISGAALTGIDAGVFSSSSNPTVTSNKTLGFIWANSVTGEMFNCTDATTNANIWKNVGAGFSGKGKCFGGLGGGVIAGYAAGSTTTGPFANGRIEKYSYTSDSNSTNHGTLAQGVYMTGASSSATHGYLASGVKRSDVANPIIERFAFATANSQAVVTGATIHASKQDVQGHSSKTHGYCSGGGGPVTNTIEKYAFGSSTTVVDHGDLVAARQDAGAACSVSHGYSMGGNVSNTLIDRFSFASSANAVTHSSLITGGLFSRRGGHSSNEYGFISGGNPTTNLVETFAFSSESTATDHTNLHTAIVAHGSSSSVTHGYCSGGPDGANSRNIQKFAFVSPGATGSDVADLIDAQNNYGHGGCQY
jgi:hypothetical protein